MVYNYMYSINNDNIILYNYGCEDLPEEKQNPTS